MLTPKRAYELLYHHLPFVMLTPIERVLLHLFLIVFVSFISYGFYNLIPSNLSGHLYKIE